MIKRIITCMIVLTLLFSSSSFAVTQTKSTKLTSNESRQYYDENKTKSGTISVSAFGAVGNGVRDDLQAIQDALYYCSRYNKVLTFDKGKTYKISDRVWVPSNTNINGQDATIYMPSQSSKTDMFFSSHSEYKTDIQIFDLNFRSDCDRNGNGYEEGKKISNVQGIYFSGVDGFLLEDVHFENLDIAIKFGNPFGELNENIIINRFSVNNASTGLYFLCSKDVVVSNGYIDVKAGGDQRLHDVYLAGGDESFLFENVMFANSPGSGINIFNSFSKVSASRDIQVVDCTFYQCKRGVTIWSDTETVYMKDNTVIACSLAVSVNYARDIVCEGLTVYDAKHVGVDKGVFLITNASDITVTDSTFDCEGMEGCLFLFNGDVENVSVSGIDAYNIGSALTFHTHVTNKANVSDVTVIHSRFGYSSRRADLVYDGEVKLY